MSLLFSVELKKYSMEDEPLKWLWKNKIESQVLFRQTQAVA